MRYTMTNWDADVEEKTPKSEKSCKVPRQLIT